MYQDDPPEREEAIRFFEKLADCCLLPRMNLPPEIERMSVEEANAYLREHPFQEEWSMLNIGRQSPITDSELAPSPAPPLRSSGGVNRPEAVQRSAVPPESRRRHHRNRQSAQKTDLPLFRPPCRCGACRLHPRRLLTCRAAPLAMRGGDGYGLRIPLGPLLLPETILALPDARSVANEEPLLGTVIRKPHHLGV